MRLEYTTKLDLGLLYFNLLVLKITVTIIVVLLYNFSALWSSHETALLCQLLDSGGLSSSWAEVILPIVRTVTDIIRPDVKNDSDDMDIRQ